MNTKLRTIKNWLGSRWLFGGTLVLFALETGYLAVTARFPMRYDEQYHLGLIQFFSHRLDPIVISQTPSTYKFGAIVQDPSFLYHYLMSFPYRLTTVFTHNIVTQVIVLRLINVALGVITLFLLWKLLKLLRISSALANVILVAFAFTPLVGDLFAQISYDNLLLPAVLVCTYETIVLTRQLRRGSFDSRAGLLLLAFCLFASLIKYAFLPIFAGIVVLVGWGVVSSWRTDAAGLMATARKTFAAISGRAKLALLAACLLSLGLCIKMYGVNLVRYHTPVPQCNQVLNARDCHHYYAWDYNYRVKSYNQAHHTARMSLLHYTGIWITINLSEPFVALIPLIATPTYTFPVYLIAVWLLGTLAFACTVVNFKKLLQNRDLLALTFISFVYICSLWARNYHDFLRMGQPVALHARYLLPVLVYLYILLAVGVHSGLDGLRQHMALAAKTALALVLIVTFVCGGGFVQYVHYIYPRYGRLGPSNGFELLDASQYQ